MKKRFSKAARQTMLAAVTLALLLAPFVCLCVQKVKNEALDSAFLWTIHAPHDVETYLSEHGLRPDSMRCTCCSCLHFTDFSSANNPSPFRLYFSRKGGGSL